MATRERSASTDFLFSEDADDSRTSDDGKSDSNDDNEPSGSGIPPSGTVLAFSTEARGTTMPAATGRDLPVFPSITHNMHRDTFTFQSVHRHEHVTARHIHYDMVMRIVHHHHYHHHTHHHVHLSCTNGRCVGGQPSPEPEPHSSDKSEFVGNLQALKSSSCKRRRRQK